MATVATIEPASLVVTPGQAGVFTLSVRNDGDDVDAYHLSVVDDAAGHVDIEPETLLVHPGQTGTAEATVDVSDLARWPAGDLIVRFHIVPAVDPDDFVVVEAMVTIEAFSEVAAALSPPALQGRRSDDTVISIANGGNTGASADVAVSAGELSAAIDRAHVTVGPGSSEDVELRLHIGKPLWRGDPVQHPFSVTVTPEGGTPIALDGTFTQVTVLPKWGLWTALGAVAAVMLIGVVWLAALAWGNVRGVPVAQSTTTPTATPTETAVVAVVDVAVNLEAGRSEQAGDPTAAVLDVDVEEAPDDALIAVEVEWPDELVLAQSDCEGWVGAEIDRELRGAPRSGDECLIDPSRSRGEAELTFTTPPAGFRGDISATATRLLTIESGEAQELETSPDSEFGQADLAIEASPYPFWLEVTVTEPPDDGTGQVTIGVHRTLMRDGTDRFARMEFELLLPGFAELSRMDGCDGFGANEATCVLFFPPEYDYWAVTATFEASGASPDAGTVSAHGVALTVDDVPVPSAQVVDHVRSSESLLVVGRDLFPVDVEVNPEEAESGDTVTATVTVTHAPFPSGVDAFRDGSWLLGVALAWPEALVVQGEPRGCTAFAGGVCEIPGPPAGDRAVITLTFTVAHDAFENGDVLASGAVLTYDPTSDADRLDERAQPTVQLPAQWVGADAESFFPF